MRIVELNQYLGGSFMALRISNVRTVWLLAVVILGVGRPAACTAADWPTFGHDNHRSGATAESIRPPLTLRWTFEPSAPPAEGWAPPVNGYGARKNKPNVSYDDAPRPIAVDGVCYFSSSGDNAIHAIDAASGEIRWTHFTDAAPRLAPAYWEGRLFVGADDGRFRCLNAADGRMLWEIDAAGRPDLMLGHGRFASLRPIRAASIVDDGVAYFTAGLFPQFGVELFAVDASSGDVHWRERLDDGGLDAYTPQGPILSLGDSVLLTSRIAPARFAKRDGRRIDLTLSPPPVPDAHEYRFYNGGSDAQVWNGDRLVHGQACLLGYDVDSVVQDKWGKPHRGTLAFHWFGARQAIHDEGLVYLATDEHLLAVRASLLPELALNECLAYERAYKDLHVAGYLDQLDRRAEAVRRYGEDDSRVRELDNGPLKWGRDDYRRWLDASAKIFARLERRCEWMTPLVARESLILAGDVLYAGGEEGVYAIDASSGEVLWEHSTGSRVRGLAASDGRLYVGSIDGAVRCFERGEESARTIRPASREHATDIGEPLDAIAKRVVARISEDDALRTGYCLILGRDDVELAAAIARATDMRVELLTPEADALAPMRRSLAAGGLHGGRVTVRPLPDTRLPYAPYVFNLVIDQAALDGDDPSLALDELMRVVKPCGGVGIIGKGDASRATSWFAARNMTPRSYGDWLEVARGGLPGARDWTHNYATAANTYCSEDSLVKGPFGVLWYGRPGPRERIDRHATPPMPLVVDGVMYTIGYDRVMAYDAYNGVRYWRRELPGADRQGLPINTSNLVADRTGLFIVAGDRECLRLDARSGETLRRYPVPTPDGEDDASWTWIALDDGLLYGALAEHDPASRRVDPQRSKGIFAIDVQDGETRWTYSGKGIDHDGIALDDGRVYFLDRRLAEEQRRRAVDYSADEAAVPDRPAVDRRGQPIPRDVRLLVALDARTGKVIWEKPLDVSDITLDDVVVQGRGGVACMVKDGVVVVHGTGSLGHPHKEFLAGEFARRALYAFDASTGDFLWGGRKGYRKRPIIVGDAVYAEPFAWDLKTGRRKMIANPLSERMQPLDFHRGYIGCGHILGSAQTIFGAKDGVAYANLDSHCGFTPFAGMALACGLCAVPADGVLVVPEGRAGCTCDTPIYTSIALYPDADAEAWSVGFVGQCAETVSLPVRRLSVNLGAPGFRQDDAGALWIPYPARTSPGLLGDWLPTYQHDQAMCYRIDEARGAVERTGVPWVFSSGYAHEKPLEFTLRGPDDGEGVYTLRLYFAEPEQLAAGDRVFSVHIQDAPAIEDIDIVAAAGGARRALVREIHGVRVRDKLKIELTASESPTSHGPILSGFQAILEE